MHAALIFVSNAQSPEIDSWVLNTTGYQATYWDASSTLQTIAEEADCQTICYTNDSVWVAATGLTTEMGYWTNPGTPSNQGVVWRIPRNPTIPSVKEAQPNNAGIGVLVTGIPIYGHGGEPSYNSSTNSTDLNGDGLWFGEVVVSEGSTLDTMGAHPTPLTGAYHTHASARPMWEDTDTSNHSPLIGWAFDGHPIYGPYGYSDPMDATSTVTRMLTGYSLRVMSDRSTLPDGSASVPPGPANFSSFPLGTFVQDYEWLATNGDLDEYNGRFCVTPEYPAGTYAYFTTVDANWEAVFPYFIGINYYGTPDHTNYGDAPTTQMPTSCTIVDVEETNQFELETYPNPTDGLLSLNSTETLTRVLIYSCSGSLLKSIANPNIIDVSDLAPGVYILNAIGENGMKVTRFIRQ